MWLLIFAIPTVVLITGLVMRMVPRRLEAVRFEDTTQEHAAMIVLSYAEGTYENRVGYPTGFYVFDEKSSSLPAKVVLKEAQPNGTVTDGCALGTSAIGAVGFEEGCGTGCVTMMIAGIVAAPFYIISGLDRLYRTSLRSKVVVDLRPVDGDTIATVSLHGIGAFLMKERYQNVLHLPELPERLRAPLPAPSTDTPPTEPTAGAA